MTSYRRKIRQLQVHKADVTLRGQW